MFGLKFDMRFERRCGARSCSGEGDGGYKSWSQGCNARRIEPSIEEVYIMTELVRSKNV